ncbi:hypothetical protein BHE74_00017948 [Ensete ventricosum]|nr:hypothetical protein BHE74_00017948 [Ensete ventricosum]
MYQNFQAVQEYSRRTLELPAVAPSTAYFVAGDDEVLLTETDLEGYDLDEDFEGFNTPSSKIAEADMLTCSIRDDEVLVYEADLEGYYDTFTNAGQNKCVSANEPVGTRTMMEKLSGLCSSWKYYSIGTQSLVSRVHQIHG